eukprot:199589-Pyramimonas_sp.AAC.1
MNRSTIRGICHVDRGRTDGNINQPKSYECPACDYVALDNEDLRRHLLVEHLQPHLFLTYLSLSCLAWQRPSSIMDWLMPSALKRGPEAGEGDQRGKYRRVDKPEDGHVNSKLLRQLESRIGALEFGSGLAVYGPSDAFQITMLKAMYSDYQKQ